MLFKRVSEYVVHLATLAEAEGRSLRHAVAKLGLGFSITLVSAGLMLFGSMLLLTGLWLGMHKELGDAWASTITGVVALLMSCGALYAAIRVHK